MNVIFLDIDGVLNSVYTTSNDKYNLDINISKLKLIKNLARKTNSKIVLSSARRNGWNQRINCKKLRMLFSDNGVSIYDITKILKEPFSKKEFTPCNGVMLTKDEERGLEILDYLNNHEIENFVIFDDIISFYNEYLDNHLVVTKFEEYGLRKEDIKKAIKILNKKED